jgi:site-specific DNA recombinase
MVMQKAIGYIRVSTQGQVDDGVSLASQRAKIEAWCLANDYELVTIQEDAGVSGTRSDRDGMQDALAGLSKGMALVVYSLSRLTRSTKAMLALSEQLDKKGIDLVSLTEKIDTTTASGKMVFRMLAVLNEFERDQISERTKAALSYKKAKGEKYSPVPFGYAELEGRLVAVEAEAKVVAQILSMREQGRTLAFIADYLNKEGIEGKRGGKWYPSTVTYLIQRQAA